MRQDYSKNRDSATAEMLLGRIYSARAADAADRARVCAAAEYAQHIAGGNDEAILCVQRRLYQQAGLMRRCGVLTVHRLQLGQALLQLQWPGQLRQLPQQGGRPGRQLG